MTIALDVVTIALAGVMVGNEVAIALFINPILWRMEERNHAHASAALATATGIVMPAWYAVTLILTLAAIWEHRRSLTHGPGPFLLVAAFGWCASITLTALRLSPLNDRLGRMDPDMPHAGWLSDRSRWDGLHRWRVALLLGSLSFLSLGVLGAWRDYVPETHTQRTIQSVDALDGSIQK